VSTWCHLLLDPASRSSGDCPRSEGIVAPVPQNGGCHGYCRRDRQRRTPFRVEILEEELADLRRRIEATRWPSKELVADRPQ
jgi:hypothetical protein